MSKNQISLSQLPMQDVAAYLKIVNGFTVKNEYVTDTQKVAGIKAENIAIAYTKADGTVDRTTVSNAMKLNGIDASEYLTASSAETLLTDTYKVSTTTSNEIKSIRDELYQLKSELAKAGLITQNYVYNGFYDAFKNGTIKYVDKEITVLDRGESSNTISKILVEDASDIMVNQFIAIVPSSEDNEIQVSQVIGKSGKELELYPEISGPLSPSDIVLKYAGTYNKGTFTFGKKLQNTISDAEIVSIVKDGSNRVVIKELGSGIKGFATKIANLYSLNGKILNKIRVSLSTQGNPGIIRASLYKIKNEKKCEFELIAKSESINAATVQGVLREYSFEFEQEIVLDMTNNEYLVLISSEYTSHLNKWYIGGYTESCADACACCSGDTWDYYGDGAFQSCINNDDAFIALHTKDVIENDIEHFTRGLYTCKTEIPDNFTRLRVEMRINREGIYQVDESDYLVCDKSNPLRINVDGSYQFMPDDKIIIGNQIAEIYKKNNNKKFTLKEPTYTPLGADIYRMGYKVVATVKKKSIDLSNKLMPIQYENTKVIEIPLVAVLNGKEPGKENYSSDRLIFEAEIEPSENSISLNEFNDLEVQIYWSNDYYINDNGTNAGKILDLAISTDRAYNKEV